VYNVHFGTGAKNGLSFGAPVALSDKLILHT
jgi:hypothetical protein